jgi:hypothetical protein
VPFKSKAQARFMFAKHPKIASRWLKKSSGKHPIKGLPQHKAPRRKQGRSK